jgi:hypothetical protein
LAPAEELENDKKQRDYAFAIRREKHKLDGKRRVKSTELKTYEIMALYDEQVAGSALTASSILSGSTRSSR